MTCFYSYENRNDSIFSDIHQFFNPYTNKSNIKQNYTHSKFSIHSLQKSSHFVSYRIAFYPQLKKISHFENFPRKIRHRTLNFPPRTAVELITINEFAGGGLLKIHKAFCRQCRLGATSSPLFSMLSSFSQKSVVLGGTGWVVFTLRIHISV